MPESGFSRFRYEVVALHYRDAEHGEGKHVWRYLRAQEERRCATALPYLAYVKSETLAS